MNDAVCCSKYSVQGIELNLHCLRTGSINDYHCFSRLNWACQVACRPSPPRVLATASVVSNDDGMRDRQCPELGCEFSCLGIQTLQGQWSSRLGMTLLSVILDRGLATQTTWTAKRLQLNTAPLRMLQSQRLPVWAMQSLVTRNRLIVVLLNITHTMVWSAYHLKNPCHNDIAVGVVK